MVMVAPFELLCHVAQFAAVPTASTNLGRNTPSFNFLRGWTHSASLHSIRGRPNDAGVGADASTPVAGVEHALHEDGVEHVAADFGCCPRRCTLGCTTTAGSPARPPPPLLPAPPPPSSPFPYPVS
eukprot:6179908-Pleurochrysis_carterae.AAC.5